MAKRDKHENLTISITDAVETLSRINDPDFNLERGLAQTHQIIIQNKKSHQEIELTINNIKETFRVILNYLHQFYEDEFSYVNDLQTIEGIKTIMVLVGEAAKKLDRYTNLFKNIQSKSVTELEEYKDLQDFYVRKIARKIDESVLGKWILGLIHKEEEDLNTSVVIQTKHVFVDLETVKKDTDYELFLVRKEDGTRFFNPRLLRNIKLVCDFGESIGERRSTDNIFTDIKLWQDKVFHKAAKDILKFIGQDHLSEFYYHLRDQKNTDLSLALNEACMALLLCANPHNLLRHLPLKSCVEYFTDFQFFLRLALKSKEYQKFLAYPPNKEMKLANSLLELTSSMCQAFFTSISGYDMIAPEVEQIVIQARRDQSNEHLDVKSKSSLWSVMASDYMGMSKLIKKHPYGPLMKILDIFDEETYHLFDPIMQHNIPNHLYDICFQERKIENFRLPSPIQQEFIDKAFVVEEFKAFLRSFSKSNLKYLLFNLQDRTNWKDLARCESLENLQNQEDFKESLVVITLPTETDFFNQVSSFQDINRAKDFIHKFKEQLTHKNNGNGFYFPKAIKEKLFPDFINGVMEAIHHVFFHNRNVLSKEDRLNFIEIFYLFLELKIIEIVNPESFSLATKDGLDLGIAQSVLLFIFIKILNEKELSKIEFDYLNLILYTPSILIRERLMLSDSFNRMLSVLKVIELVRDESGFQKFNSKIRDSFEPLFNTTILQSFIVMNKKSS